MRTESSGGCSDGSSIGQAADRSSTASGGDIEQQQHQSHLVERRDILRLRQHLPKHLLALEDRSMSGGHGRVGGKPSTRTHPPEHLLHLHRYILVRRA